MQADYYALLGVERNADFESIKVAYRKRAVECHPDHGGSTQEMQLINMAWEVLSNPKLRKVYDDAFGEELERLLRSKAGQENRAHDFADRRATQGAWVIWLAESAIAVFVFLFGGFFIGIFVAERIVRTTSLLSDNWLVGFIVVLFGGILGLEIGNTVLEKISERVKEFASG